MSIFGFKKILRVEITRAILVRPGQTAEVGDVLDLSEGDVRNIGDACKIIGELDDNDKLIVRKASASTPAIPKAPDGDPIPADTDSRLVAMAKLQSKLSATHQWLRDLRRQENETTNYLSMEGGFEYREAVICRRVEAERAIPKIGDELRRERIKAAAVTLDIFNQAKQAVADLAALGFQIFSARIAALGLAEDKARQLFRGSATFIKYTLPDLGTPLLRQNVDDRGRVALYIDGGPSAVAHYLHTAEETIAKAKPLLAEAKAELAKVEKAFGAAAR